MSSRPSLALRLLAALVMRPLGLTTPLARGPQIREVQEILNGQNVFEHDFLKGSVDGVFGPESAQATYRGYYWTGFSLAHLNSPRARMYGDTLHRYLTVPDSLPDRNLEHRKERLRAAARRPLREKALAKAITQIGVHEEGSANDVLYSRWYLRVREAPAWAFWCAYFTSWCYDQVGSAAFARGVFSGFCPEIVRAARSNQRGLLVVRDPSPGDLVLYDWTGNGDADHIGMFEKWKNRSSGHFVAIEGNTAPDDRGNQSNGGGVYRRGEQPTVDTRKLSQVQCFVRVGR